MDYIIYFVYDRKWVQIMNCKSCGAPLDAQQKFCPNCGTPVDNASFGNSTTMNTLNSIPNNVPGAIPTQMTNSVPNNIPSGFNNQPSILTGFGTGVNVNQPSDIGFNRNDEHDLNQFGSNDPYANRAGTMTKDSLVNQMSAGFGGYNQAPSTTMSMEELHEGGSKKKFPWIGIAIALVVIMVGGIVGLPLINSYNLKTYESDDYVLEYNGNWTLDEDQDKMTLYYSDKDSRFLLNAVSTFASLKFSIDDEEDKKVLYKAFYDAWSNVDGGELTGGTETFLTLNDDTMYARVDYKMTGRENIGAFYVVVSETKDKVISFMSYCTEDNWDKIDKDVIKMLKSITYKTEADSSAYDKFDAGNVKDYTAIGYMDYKMPDSWTLDEERSKSTGYKSYIFKFRDGTSLLDVKGVTPYNSTTLKTGTTYEAMKETIIKNYGAIKEEKTKTINGKVWYVVITPDYKSGGNSYHNEIYFTLSASNTHLYYFEAYVSNVTSENKTSFFNESIEYILESVKLYKVDE